MTTFVEWIKKVENILMQYNEGAIMAHEAFNAIIARACEVDEPQPTSDVHYEDK